MRIITPLPYLLRLLVLLTLVVLALAGCGDSAERDTAESTDGEVVPSSSDSDANRSVEHFTRVGPEEKLEPREGEVPYTSREGDFHVIWPEGCSKIRVRTQPDPASEDAEDILLAHIFCDRPERVNEGCSVTVYFQEKGETGGYPDPPVVIENCMQVMESYGVEIIGQRPVIRANLEGIQLLCQEPGTESQVWLEGLLAGARIYLLTAWKAEGDLFTDEDYIRFFDSFYLVGW